MRATGPAFVIFVTGLVTSALPAQEYIISTVVGPIHPGSQGFSGDGGPATSAKLNDPQDVVIDQAGNLFIADTFNNRVRKVSTNGTITTIAGGGTGGLGDGGPALSARVQNPWALAIDAAGNLFVGERNTFRVRKISSAGIITTVAGTGVSGFSGDGGPAINAKIDGPTAIAVDGSGNLFIAEYSRIRKVSPAGMITTFAGAATDQPSGFSGDGGPAVNAKLNQPQGVGVDSAGNVYIADTSNRRIRKVSTDGIITTVATPSEEPRRVAFDSSGNLYFSDGAHISKLTPNGIVSVLITGSGNGDYSGDGGLAGLANLLSFRGLSVDKAGDVYVSGNNAIHVLRPLSPVDLKPGYWDVTETIAMPLAAQMEAYEKMLANVNQYPENQRAQVIASIKAGEQALKEQAAKGVESKRNICVSSEHPMQSLLFDNQTSGVCTVQTAISKQKLTMDSTCSSGADKSTQSYVVERVDATHFKGSLHFVRTDEAGKVTLDSSRTFTASWNRASCLAQ